MVFRHLSHAMIRFFFNLEFGNNSSSESWYDSPVRVNLVGDVSDFFEKH